MDDPTSTQASDLPTAVRQLAEAVHTLAVAAQRDPDALLTAEQVGKLLGLSPRTLKDQAAARVFPHRRFGKHYRFSRDDVAEMVRHARCASRIPDNWKEKKWPTAS
ncbi:helix-turn-helix domain-containing protein [Amycolatopsis sp. 195334CR]|uniref:helix-turn-helix domain-containing protein n=1 Tax=Amycolatopsis sp. 195334CR TaxID=2814588 RepID=UPI001A8F0E4A|nr:helix-turn-helix domain-containing protein [Amycolatopsis sp. 195334CR]MBN6041233.1 helix-turn-helix domain-containing protein [Amycolatopsis sp. 195334CR]